MFTAIAFYRYFFLQLALIAFVVQGIWLVNGYASPVSGLNSVAALYPVTALNPSVASSAVMPSCHTLQAVTAANLQLSEVVGFILPPLKCCGDAGQCKMGVCAAAVLIVTFLNADLLPAANLVLPLLTIPALPTPFVSSIIRPPIFA